MRQPISSVTIMKDRGTIREPVNPVEYCHGKPIGPYSVIRT